MWMHDKLCCWINLNDNPALTSALIRAKSSTQQRHSFAITFVTDLREAGRAAAGPLSLPVTSPCDTSSQSCGEKWTTRLTLQNYPQLQGMAAEELKENTRFWFARRVDLFFFFFNITLTAEQLQRDHANTYEREERKLFTFFFFFCMKGFRGQRCVLTDNAGLIWTIRSQRLRRSPGPCGPVSSVIITFRSHPPPPWGAGVTTMILTDQTALPWCVGRACTNIQLKRKVSWSLVVACGLKWEVIIIINTFSTPTVLSDVTTSHWKQRNSQHVINIYVL